MTAIVVAGSHSPTHYCVAEKDCYCVCTLHTSEYSTLLCARESVNLYTTAIKINNLIDMTVCAAHLLTMTYTIHVVVGHLATIPTGVVDKLTYFQATILEG